MEENTQKVATEEKKVDEKNEKNVVITSESVELNEMQQTSLMESLEKLQKKQLMYTRVSAILILILVVAIISVLPSVFRTLSIAQEAMNNANTALVNANDMILQGEQTLDEVSELVGTTQTNLVEATNKLNSIDFEGLNGAIKDLGDVVEPMANFFNSFNRTRLF